MKIKNAVIVLITGKNLDRVLLLKDRYNKKWMIPGGILEKYDKSVFCGMKREFKEETGFNLPKIYNKKAFNYKGHTAIFIGYSKNKFPKFRPTEEAIEMKFVKLDKILSYNLKTYVKSSFKKLIEKNLI